MTSPGKKIRNRRSRDRDSAVYLRDGWQCRMPECLCPDGRDIDPELRGSPEMWSPSVDHIIPLAQGGLDIDANTRSAHRRCNEAAAGIPRRKPRPERTPGPLTYRIGDLFPGVQGSRWS